jgi:hypothetical protein
MFAFSAKNFNRELSRIDANLNSRLLAFIRGEILLSFAAAVKRAFWWLGRCIATVKPWLNTCL